MNEYKLEPDIEFMTVIPKHSVEEKAALERSIVAWGGAVEPITLWRGKIVDGYARYDICIKHKLPYEVRELDMETRDDVIRWIIETHIARRHLSVMQRVRLAETYRQLFAKEAKERQGHRTDLSVERTEKDEVLPEKKRESENDPQKQNRYRKKEEKTVASNDAGKENRTKKDQRRLRRKNETGTRLAKLSGVSETTYRKALYILEYGNEELIARVDEGEMTIHKAYCTLKAETMEDGSALGANVAQVVKEIEKLEELLAWFTGFGYECEGEIVTDSYIGPIRLFIKAAHVLTDTMESFSKLSENGIISIDPYTDNEEAAETDAA